MKFIASKNNKEIEGRIGRYTKGKQGLQLTTGTAKENLKTPFYTIY